MMHNPIFQTKHLVNDSVWNLDCYRVWEDKQGISYEMLKGFPHL
jgi:hypothetical protein